MKPLDLVNPTKYYNWARIRIKRRAVLRRLKSVGDNFLFDVDSTFMTLEHIEIGNNVFIGERAHISADLIIGNNVMFGPRPTIIGGDHYFGVRGKFNFFLHPKDRENSQLIVIEDDAWFGACVMILKGVVAGMGTVVGAGSLVSRSLPPYCVSVGNPCRPRKKIFTDEILEEHIVELGYDREFARQIVRRRTIELKEWKIADLPVIDQTGLDWETRDQFAEDTIATQE